MRVVSVLDCGGLGFHGGEASPLLLGGSLTIRMRGFAEAPHDPTLDTLVLTRRFICIPCRSKISALILTVFSPGLGCKYRVARHLSSRDVGGKCQGCYSIYRLSISDPVSILICHPAFHCLYLLSISSVQL